MAGANYPKADQESKMIGNQGLESAAGSVLENNILIVIDLTCYSLGDFWPISKEGIR